jgi:catechol 2,3-dioxygenase-like lactoylglutathione lyase family enzyme
VRVRAIDFVVVNVADVARSVRFYRDTLGVEAPLWEDTPHWQEFQTAPVAVALRADPSGAGRNAAIALAVEDVAAAVAELRAEGVPVLLEPRENDVCFAAMIQDPDGNLLLLHQRKDGTAG